MTYAQSVMLETARPLAARGLGWEDICVRLEISKPSESGQLIRRMVLDRGRPP